MQCLKNQGEQGTLVVAAAAPVEPLPRLLARVDTP